MPHNKEESKMKITRRTDYAIHLIAELAENPDKSLGLRTLADRHNVTYAFARTVQKGLLDAKIIKTTRGINGGIMLVKELDEITLLDVFEAAQESLATTLDVDKAPWCSCEKGCLSNYVWDSTKTVLDKHFSKITMKQVLSSSK
jgi:Rrf2 family protein